MCKCDQLVTDTILVNRTVTGIQNGYEIEFDDDSSLSVMWLNCYTSDIEDKILVSVIVQDRGNVHTEILNFETFRITMTEVGGLKYVSAPTPKEPGDE